MLVAKFIRGVVGAPAILVGNSMGGMVSLLMTDAHPELVDGLVLVDPSIPAPRQAARHPGRRPVRASNATPFLGERYLQGRTRRLSDRQRVQSVVDLCFADPSKADPDVVDAGVALAAHRRTVPGQEAAFLARRADR
jgi:pimeloyl-ACP methyl ester carboxylesterase